MEVEDRGGTAGSGAPCSWPPTRASAHTIFQASIDASGTGEGPGDRRVQPGLRPQCLGRPGSPPPGRPPPGTLEELIAIRRDRRSGCHEQPARVLDAVAGDPPQDRVLVDALARPPGVLDHVAAARVQEPVEAAAWCPRRDRRGRPARRRSRACAASRSDAGAGGAATDHEHVGSSTRHVAGLAAVRSCGPALVTGGTSPRRRADGSLIDVHEPRRKASAASPRVSSRSSASPRAKDAILLERVLAPGHGRRSLRAHAHPPHGAGGFSADWRSRRPEGARARPRTYPSRRLALLWQMRRRRSILTLRTSVGPRT